jgi:hypothetical protein
MANVFRVLWASLALATLVVWSPVASSDLSAQGAAELPDYVIEEFGQPPAVPDGPLSGGLQRAAQVVFVDTIEQGAWTADQQIALERDRRRG